MFVWNHKGKALQWPKYTLKHEKKKSHEELGMASTAAEIIRWPSGSQLHNSVFTMLYDQVWLFLHLKSCHCCTTINTFQWFSWATTQSLHMVRLLSTEMVTQEHFGEKVRKIYLKLTERNGILTSIKAATSWRTRFHSTWSSVLKRWV